MSQIAETSREAYKQIQLIVGTCRAAVYRLIADATERRFDMTNMEIARALGWDINCVTPRVKELRDSGLVVLSQKRECGVTGFVVFAWRTEEKKS